MSIPNIVFVGKAGAGRTTASRLLRERFPDLGFDVISFATPLKVGLATETDRHRLQEFGTDVVRAYDDMFWVQLFLWHLELRTRIRGLASELQAGPGADHTPILRWCNDDCRFENEVATLQDAGWAIVEVRAPRAARIERLKRNGKLTDEAQLDHSSEDALGALTPDYVLINDMDEFFLEQQLKAVLEQLANA